MITTYPFLKPNWLLLFWINSVNFAFIEYSNNFEIMGLMGNGYNPEVFTRQSISDIIFRLRDWDDVAVTKSDWYLLA